MSEQSTQNDQSLETLLMDAGIVVNNAALGDILDVMTPYGYPLEEVQVGQTFHSKALTLQQKREKEFGDQIGATAKTQGLKNSAHKNYIKTLKLTRIQLDDDTTAVISLGLQGRRKKSISGWVLQGKQFYINLLNSPKWLSKVAELNITEEKLLEELAAIEETEKAYYQQQDETSEAQEATLKRDEALDKLFDWTARYKKIARIALEDHPQWLEKLGIVEKA